MRIMSISIMMKRTAARRFGTGELSTEELIPGLQGDFERRVSERAHPRY